MFVCPVMFETHFSLLSLVLYCSQNIQEYWNWLQWLGRIFLEEVKFLAYFFNSTCFSIMSVEKTPGLTFSGDIFGFFGPV